MTPQERAEAVVPKLFHPDCDLNGSQRAEVIAAAIAEAEDAAGSVVFMVMGGRPGESARDALIRLQNTVNEQREAAVAEERARLLRANLEHAAEKARLEEREAIARIFDKRAEEAEPGQWGEKLGARDDAAMIRARSGT